MPFQPGPFLCYIRDFSPSIQYMGENYSLIYKVILLSISGNIFYSRLNRGESSLNFITVSVHSQRSEDVATEFLQLLKVVRLSN